jgi:uncharacterized repeat protein (TIGR01451 family)
MAETPLAESRSIDDQIEWLDDQRVLYGDEEGDLWALPADGSGAPRKFMSKASSPAVVRTKDPPPAAPGTADTLVLPQTDLALDVSTQPGRVGADLTYTVAITNQGPVDATGVTMHFEIPEGVDFGNAVGLSVPASSYGCARTGNHVTCDTHLVPSGGVWTLAITIRPKTEGILRSRVWINQTERDTLPDNDVVTTEMAITGDG